MDRRRRPGARVAVRTMPQAFNLVPVVVAGGAVALLAHALAVSLASGLLEFLRW